MTYARVLVIGGTRARLFSLKHEFPTDWYRFLHPTDTTVTPQTISLLFT